MQTTFILAGNFNVTPFEIMHQDLDEVIMIVNYLAESGKASKQDDIKTKNILNEKEQDRSFWAALQVVELWQMKHWARLLVQTLPI